MVSPSSTNVRVTQIGNMIFRVCFVDSFQGYVVAKFAIDDLQGRPGRDPLRPAAGLLQGPGRRLRQGVPRARRRHRRSARPTPAATSTSPPSSSRSRRPTPTRSSSRATTPTSATSRARPASSGITAPLLGGDGWDSDKLTQIGGDAIEGSYYSNHYSFEEQRPEVQDFVKKYQARYGRVPDGLAALGYDAAAILMDVDGPGQVARTASTWPPRSPRPGTSRASPATSPSTRTATPRSRRSCSRSGTARRTSSTSIGPPDHPLPEVPAAGSSEGGGSPAAAAARSSTSCSRPSSTAWPSAPSTP